jgi:hypothetical protein
MIFFAKTAYALVEHELWQNMSFPVAKMPRRPQMKLERALRPNLTSDFLEGDLTDARPL